MRRPATNEGALSTPEIPISPIAIQTFDGERVGQPGEPHAQEAEDEPAPLAQPIGVVGHQQAADHEADRGQALLQAVLELGGVQDLEGEREEQHVLQAEDEHHRDAQQDHRAQDRRARG